LEYPLVTTARIIRIGGKQMFVLFYGADLESPDSGDTAETFRRLLSEDKIEEAHQLWYMEEEKTLTPGLIAKVRLVPDAGNA
jgi:hypothetical protein